ncbi:MAG: SGNH/GDSL hydrolase family protein [Vicingaceae bacterium]
MKKIIFSFLLLSTALACNNSKNASDEGASKPKDQTMNYIALGDSYTIGEGLGKDGIWPYLLYKELKSKGFNLNQPKIIARTGWRTDELMQAIKHENLSSKFELVSLLIGVNNQYQGKSIEDYKSDLITLLETSISLSENGKEGVFMLSIPDYGVTPFAKSKGLKNVSEEIDNYNKIAKELATQFGVLYFDITDISRTAAEDKSMLTEDMLHPSAKMYKKWVDAISNQVVEKLLLDQGYKASK